MSDLHSVVCVKAVPKPEEIRVDPESNLLIRDGVRSEINPPDMNAMEMALRLKDRLGGRISILSMGPPNFDPLLRVALSMGADHVYLLSDRAFAGADTLATTYTLSRAVHKIMPVDIIFCGEESSDGATVQVPPGLAEWLGIQQLTMLTEVTVDYTSRVARGRREIKGGYELLEVQLPCVVSVKTASNEPRFMDYRIKEWAFEPQQVTVWNAKDLDVDESLIGQQGSPTWVTGLAEATTRQRRKEFIAGTDQEIGRRIAAILKDT